MRLLLRKLKLKQKKQLVRRKKTKRLLLRKLKLKQKKQLVRRQTMRLLLRKLKLKQKKQLVRRKTKRLLLRKLKLKQEKQLVRRKKKRRLLLRKLQLKQKKQLLRRQTKKNLQRVYRKKTPQSRHLRNLLLVKQQMHCRIVIMQQFLLLGRKIQEVTMKNRVPRHTWMRFVKVVQRIKKLNSRLQTARIRTHYSR